MPTLTMPPRLLAAALDAFDMAADGAPIDACLVTDTRGRLATALAASGHGDAVADLGADHLGCLEDCFTVGAEGDPDVPDDDYHAVLGLIRAARDGA